MKKLYKSRTDVKIDGVCAGIADYFGLDATLVRAAFCILAIVTNLAMVIVYLLWMIIIPREPKYNEYKEI